MPSRHQSSSGRSLLASLVAVLAFTSSLPEVLAEHGAGSWYIAETGNQGTCGGFLSNDGWTVALNAVQWDGGAHCGKQVTITYHGHSETATIRDRCETCGGWGGIDMTPKLFSAFASQDEGIIQIDWEFGSGGGGGGGDNNGGGNGNVNGNGNGNGNGKGGDKGENQWKPPPSPKPKPSSTWQPPPPVTYKPSSTWTPPKSSSAWTPSSSKQEQESKSGSSSVDKGSKSISFEGSSASSGSSASYSSSAVSSASGEESSGAASDSGTQPSITADVGGIKGDGKNEVAPAPTHGALAFLNQYVLQVGALVAEAADAL